MKYPDNARLTAEALTAASAAVDAADFRRPDYFNLWQTLSGLAKSAIERGEADEGRVLWLFADACSLRLNPDDGAEPFIPVMGIGGQRSASPDDWSEEERDFLSEGYAEVANPLLRARLADARFFWDEDRKRSLADRVPDLKQVVFQAKLGTLFDKAERLATLAPAVSEAFDPSVAGLAERAGWLAKTDLLTDMVDEFDSLQGIMGGYYAAEDGEQQFVEDFVDTWHKVMTLDRFDLE